MRAWTIRDFGEPDVFETREVPTPEPPRGHVRIRVHASSVNPIDFKLRRGARPQLAPPEPRILHGDVAGIVDAVGDGVTRVAAGDPVFGCVGGYGPYPGVLADFAVADERLLARAPANISLREAAALPLVGLTASEVYWKAPVRPHEHVLVHGGTGGVGHIALQLAKTSGARVSVTCGSEEHGAIAKSLGADEVIFYKNETVESYVDRLTEGRGFDLVVDTHGGKALDSSFRAARVNGRVVTVQASAAHDLAPAHARAVSLHIVFMLIPLLHDIGRERHGRMLDELRHLVEEGRLRVLLDETGFTFDELAEAHRRMETGKHTGKVVVTHPDRT